MSTIRSILISVAIICIASQVNGDWISDLGDTISGAASSVASTLGDKKTWDQVQAAFESAGESAVSWTKEAWVSSKHGIQCLKEAKGNAEAILDCRKNLHSSLDGQTPDWLVSVTNTLGSQATWDKVQAALESAGENAVDWAKEAWVSSEAGIQCLKDARGDTDEILACRKNVHNALGGASASASASGADAATFNLFLGAGLVVLLLVRVW